MTDNSTFLKVHFGALAEAQADLGRGVGQLTGKLDELDRAAKPLVATWDGTAQEAYHARQVAWTKAAAELTAVLTEVQRALGDSLTDYQDTESRNARKFS
jgi:WXG100 family type VII secretion target